jgi:5-bromo-4-chloroindolyl phosphate hydrolysis protein
MTEDQDLQDNLEAELSACRAHASTLSMKLSVFEAAKEKAESEREAAVAEKLNSEELSESRYKMLRQKYNHYKNKSKRLLRQLAFVPKLLNP